MPVEPIERISAELTTASLSVSAMLAIIIALVALLAARGTPKGPYNIFSIPSDYLVDFGYQLNQGQAVLNDSLVTFRNIRYAAPPIGPSRFLAPTAPSVNRTSIQNASDVICPQAYPKWLTTGAVTPFTPADIPPVDPRTSEDCLFLDVLLPKKIWDTRQRTRAPVLVWIHGGGFVIGWKDASGAGYGLVSRSQQFGSEGVVLVSINYRLGLFGWMNGAGVTSNAGLLDQRFALEWIQTNIHRFGGDPSRVTILGESAGGSSVEAHIAAYGGTKGTSPFRGAIAQSSYYLPSNPQPNSLIDAVLSFGNVTSLNILRSMSSTALQKLNTLLIGNSQPFGTFTFGAVADGNYIPELPSTLFQQGRFDRTVSVMTGHNQDEGSRFVPNTLVTNESSYAAFFESLLRPPTSSPIALRQLTQELYPPVFDGSQGYTTQTERNNLTIADATFVCNARFMDEAPFTSTTYAYVFSVAPALHGGDLLYTFYDFGDVPGVNTTVAEIMQGYILRFTETGQPNDPALPVFPPARPGTTVQDLGSEGVAPALDEGGIRQLDKRCQFWRDMPYLSADGGASRAT